MNPKTRKVLTLIVMGIALLMIAGGAVTQIIGVKAVDADMTRLGVGRYYRMIGGLKIIFVALWLFPRTLKIGFMLLSCVLAGAMATLLSHGEPLFSPVLPLVLLWIATYLREPSVFFLPG